MREMVGFSVVVITEASTKQNMESAGFLSQISRTVLLLLSIEVIMISAAQSPLKSTKALECGTEKLFEETKE
jgi:hypothetical protein